MSFNHDLELERWYHPENFETEEQARFYEENFDEHGNYIGDEEDRTEEHREQFDI